MNTIKNTEAIEYTIKNIRKIVGTIGMVGVVFPPYKLENKELKDGYVAMSEALARKNLKGYDGLPSGSKKIVEMYEIASALQSLAEDFLKNTFEKMKNGHGKKLVAV